MQDPFSLQRKKIHKGRNNKNFKIKSFIYLEKQEFFSTVLNFSEFFLKFFKGTFSEMRGMHVNVMVCPIEWLCMEFTQLMPHMQVVLAIILFG